ncbi:MAG: hypothetical protein V4850_25300 [Myxococcota bacterium]
MTPPPAPAPALRPAIPPAARLRRTARVVVFSLCALFIWGGPIYEQVLHRWSPALRGWQMFSGQGLGVLQARFVAVHADGTREQLDRYAILAPGEPLPRRVERRLKNEDAAHRVARTLCTSLGADVDVRVELRRSTRKGWTTVLDGTTNECPKPRATSERAR